MEYIEINRIDENKAVVLNIDGNKYYLKLHGRLEFKTFIIDPSDIQ